MTDLYWDEVLVTHDRENTSVEVSFKKIGGDGFLLSQGDEPGTPGGVLEGEDGVQVPPKDDEGDFEPDDDTQPDSGGPVPGDNPECAEHECTAYVDYSAANGPSNILRTHAVGPSENKALATGWNIPDSGVQAGETGYFAIGGNVISDNGSSSGVLSHFKTFDDVLDITTFGRRVDESQRLAIDAGLGSDDLGSQFGCDSQFIFPARFATIQSNHLGSPSGDVQSYKNRGEGAYWVAWGEEPTYPTQPINTKLFDVETPYNEVLLVEPWEHAEFLVHAVPHLSAGWDTIPAGVVPDGGKLRFMAGSGGRWTNRVVAGDFSVGNRASFWYGESFCTLDYENETMTLDAFQIDPDSIYNPSQYIVRTWSVPRERMTNCWVKTRTTVTVRLRTAPEFYDPDAHFIEFTNRIQVSLGDYITVEISNKGRSNTFCSSPYAEDNPGNFSKYFHPDGTGTGDNVNYCGIAERGSQTSERTETYQGTPVAPWTLAATLGNAATDAERTAWARQWKTYLTEDYCQRIP